jgi:hypothetical protein
MIEGLLRALDEMSVSFLEQANVTTLRQKTVIILIMRSCD